MKNTKLINIDNSFLQMMWNSAGASPNYMDDATLRRFNNHMNHRLYIDQLHQVAKYLYSKSLPLFAEPTSRVSDSLRGDIFEIATKLEAMRTWYESESVLEKWIEQAP